jgi:hypothetical protein
VLGDEQAQNREKTTQYNSETQKLTKLKKQRKNRFAGVIVIDRLSKCP